jgi:hypothetical protein
MLSLEQNLLVRTISGRLSLRFPLLLRSSTTQVVAAHRRATTDSRRNGAADANELSWSRGPDWDLAKRLPVSVSGAARDCPSPGTFCGDRPHHPDEGGSPLPTAFRLNCPSRSIRPRAPAAMVGRLPCSGFAPPAEQHLFLVFAGRVSHLPQASQQTAGRRWRSFFEQGCRGAIPARASYARRKLTRRVVGLAGEHPGPGRRPAPSRLEADFQGFPPPLTVA